MALGFGLQTGKQEEGGTQGELSPAAFITYLLCVCEITSVS